MVEPLARRRRPKAKALVLMSNGKGGDAMALGKRVAEVAWMVKRGRRPPQFTKFRKQR